MEATEAIIGVGDGRRNVHLKRMGAHILNTTYHAYYQQTPVAVLLPPTSPEM